MENDADKKAPAEEPADSAENSDPRPKGRFPLFGCLKGTVQVQEGFDLTEPADPDWGARLND
jgi:hypothetical protein